MTVADTVELNTLGPVVKTTYEGQPNTNAFTDAEKVKLANLSDLQFSGAYADLTGKPALFSGAWNDLTGRPAYIAAGATRAAVMADIGAIPVAQKGQAGGVAPLDSAGLVPLVHLNVGGLSFKGAWNPVANAPPLIDGTGSVGDFYKADRAGTFNFGNGDFNFLTGDWVIYAGGTWQRIGTSDAVAMVNGKLGNVVLTAADVGALPTSYTAPVTTVNGKSGAVTLNAAEVGALPSTYSPPAATWAGLPDKPEIPSPYVVPRLTYADRLGSRVATTWYTNGSAHDRIVNISTNYIAASASSIIAMRAPGTTTPVFSARSQATGTGECNQIIQAIVPAGWEYRFVPGASRTVFTWFEGDYS